jgi:DNA-binding GntR family transcriptional regulator
MTSTERVAHLLRDAILRGETPPGARLGEAELAARLGVSRTPVREALPRLAAEGLVEIVPNRGARVTAWTAGELRGVFDVRAAVEPRLTALAVPRLAPEDLDALDELAGRMLAVGTPGPGQDLEALVPLNRAFHERLVTLADHPALAAALAAAVRAPIVRRNFHAYDDASLRRSLAHHAEIAAAARAADADWAEAVMTAHIANARAVMLRSAVPTASPGATSSAESTTAGPGPERTTS